MFTSSQKLPNFKTHVCVVPNQLRPYLWRFNTTKKLNESPISSPRPYRLGYWVNKKKYLPLAYLRTFSFFTTYFNLTSNLGKIAGRRITRRVAFARASRSWGFNFWPHEAAIITGYTAPVTKPTVGRNPQQWYTAQFAGLVLRTLWCRALDGSKTQVAEYARWMEIRKQVFKALCLISVKAKAGQKWKKVSNLTGMLAWTHLGTKTQWGLRNAKFKYSKKTMYVYLRYLKSFWRVSRTRDFARTLKAKVFTSTVYRQTNFKKYFGLRLESFLVSSFKVKTLQHARALINNGHVFVNGTRVLNEGLSLKRLDVVTFSTRALVWLRLLRRIRRNRKVRKLERRLTGRRGSAAIIYGPRLSHAVV